MKTYVSVTLTFLSLLFVLPVVAQEPVYSLIWSDEFEGNGLPAEENWYFQTQWIIPGVGWANGEVQHYTNRIENAKVEDGVLKIIARNETYTDEQGTKEYTSARLNSKFSFTYGKVTVRAKLPAIAGTWPAIWMLGTNINEIGGYWNDGIGQVPWPFTGEIDIMEQFGWDKSTTHGTVHHGQESGGTSNTRSISVPTSTTDFHDYEIIWNEEEIQFLVDNDLYYVYNPETRYPDIGRNTNTWPFFEPQYLLLNIAMGGVLGGTIDPNFSEDVMEIDYVRVYQLNTSTETDATLSELRVNGQLIEDFSPDSLNYTFSVEEGTSVPEVTYSTTIQDANVEVFEATEIPGTTRIQVTASNGVTQKIYSIDFEIGEPVLGVADAVTKVYPNPSNETVTIILPHHAGPKDISVIDVSGVRHSVSIQDRGTSLLVDISVLSPGIYFVHFQDLGLKSIRFIKEQ